MCYFPIYIHIRLCNEALSLFSRLWNYSKGIRLFIRTIYIHPLFNIIIKTLYNPNEIFHPFNIDLTVFILIQGSQFINIT